jgi:hypothetical protein
MDAAWPQDWPTQAEELHIFDPKGDVLLILSRRLEEDMTEKIDGYQDEESSLSESELELVIDNAKAVGSEVKLDLEHDRTTPKSQPVHMRVSSKHLILASHTFRTSLGSDIYPEGRMLQTHGNVTMTLIDEDPDVMIILLRIVHGQTRKVPRQVSLDMLTKLAAVVNHRQMLEVVEVLSDIWISAFKHTSSPAGNTPEALSWLFIFWVFRKEDEFKKITLILQQECYDDLEYKANCVAPIPASIICEWIMPVSNRHIH